MKSEVSAHVYDDGDDTTCNECGYVRQLPPAGGVSNRIVFVALVSLTAFVGCTAFVVMSQKKKREQVR